MQMAKVGVALTEGRTGEAPAAEPGADGPADAVGAAAGASPAAAADVPAKLGALAVKPQAFKTLVGRGHPEFSSNRQQVSGKPDRSVQADSLCSMRLSMPVLAETADRRQGLCIGSPS